MTDFGVFWEWLSFAARWLHVVAAIAWIGSSFYFIALDLGLRRTENLPHLAHGEEWQVHGGGFYHITKYLVAPEFLPEHLTWFKWESYFTWFSGFLMLAIVYYGSANLFLIDPAVLPMSVPVAIIVSLCCLAGGWIVYDLLCRFLIGKADTALMFLLYAVLVFIAWGLTHIFSGRAAFLHLGAITATIMSANVFMVIIPNQKIVVADLIAGRKPDPKYGKIAKQRSLHNNYLTLPVLFLMLSNHYPLAFGTEFNWVIASLVFIIGVLIRHYFNTVHKRAGNPHWTWLGALVLFIIIIWLSTVPKVLTGEKDANAVAPAFQQFASDAHFPAVKQMVSTRCSMCHAAEPVYEGIVRPPKDVMKMSCWRHNTPFGIPVVPPVYRTYRSSPECCTGGGSGDTDARAAS